MLKIIGAILTISSSTAMGFYFSFVIKARLEDLKELKKYIYIIRGDIRYAGTPLPEAISNLAQRSQNNFNEFFRKIADDLFKMEGNTFKHIWENRVKTDLMDTCLTKKDKVLLNRLGDNLGYLDREMQINTIDLYLSGLEQEIGDLNLVVKEKTRLYNLLGIMGGIFITIVMI